MKWIKIEDELPKYTDEYICACIIGNAMESFKDVRCYRYEKIKGKEPKWCIESDFSEMIYITHWCEMPDYPDDEEA